MTCCAENNFETNKKIDTSRIAGNARFLLGVMLTLIGLYIASFFGVQEHNLEFLLVLSAPFVMFTDGS